MRLAVSFTVMGKITSANMVKTPFAGHAVKTKSAREDQDRIRSIAGYEAMRSRWTIPERAAVYIEAFNSRLDVGNIEKVPVDSLKGVMIVNDNPKHLRLLQVRHADPDALGERYIVTVEALA